MVEALGAVFGALFLVSAAVFAVSMRRLLATPKASAPPLDPDLQFVARPVLNEQGERVGESVRVEGDDVVVKQGAVFLVLPKASLKDEGPHLRAASIDWTDAAKRGEAWRARQEDRISDELGKPPG